MPGQPVDSPSFHRLPYSVEPHRYELVLAPDLEAGTFSGEVRIEATVHEAVGAIVLNAAELTIEAAEFRPEGAAPVALEATLDEENERVVLSSSEDLAPGSAVIMVRFAGILNDKLHGFYRSTFADAQGTLHTIATTQFEATDARRAFPCFDEPDRKAVFAVALDVPAGLAAFSNGPIIEESPLGAGLRRVRFGDTISMSTYLVAFVVGPLVATDPVDVNGTALRIVHVPGKGDLTAFALDAGAHALRFFTQWFGIDYPGEKLDLLAIPDFAFGAMENLGCVTFRENALLVDPARASRLELERIADVISHEIAHMWFGDLVTMKWWNGIWLNEAFATLMELLCVDDFRPQWERWASFGMEREVAMSTDALHSTRPVEYAVGPPEEAQGMFDVLTYQKGASVLRMLERYLGAEAFRHGIQRYLSDHSFANTETGDLWQAIETSTGEPVQQIMDSWILQGGFPIITVTQDHDAGTVTLDQEAFSLTPSVDASAIGEIWQVPVHMRGGLSSDAPTTQILLTDARATVPALGPAGAPIVVNADAVGYYRVRYGADNLGALAQGFGALGTLERFNLLGDTWASVLAGRSDISAFLTLAGALGDEPEPEVWAEVTGPLSFLERVVDDDVEPTLAQYTRALLHPVLDRLGWDPGANDGQRTATLRSQILATLGTVGDDEAIRAEAARRYLAMVTGGAPVNPELLSAVVTLVAAGGGVEQYDAFLERYRNPDTPQDEIRYLYALTAFPEPELAARTFALARTEVRTQNAPFLIQMLLASRVHGPATWPLVRTHWDELAARLPANIFPRMLDGVKLLCRQEDLAEDVRSFLATHPVPSGQRTVDQIVERLGVNVAFATRLRAGVPGTLADAIDRLAGT